MLGEEDEGPVKAPVGAPGVSGVGEGLLADCEWGSPGCSLVDILHGIKYGSVHGGNIRPLSCQIFDQSCNLYSLKLKTLEELLTQSEDFRSIYSPPESKQEPLSSRSPSEEVGKSCASSPVDAGVPVTGLPSSRSQGRFCCRHGAAR